MSDEQKINPAYYQAGKCTCGKTLQTYDYVRHLPYADATAIKYITRHKEKNGIEDLKKAIHYLENEIKFRQGSISPSNK